MRPFNVYGPGQRLDDRRIVPDLISAALNRQPLMLYSDGRATRSFCYISDAIRAMWHVLLSDANGEAFNVGNDEREISMADFARELSAVAGPPPLEVIYRVSEDPQYLIGQSATPLPGSAQVPQPIPLGPPRWGCTEGLRRTLAALIRSRRDGAVPTIDAVMRIAREEYEPFADLRHLFLVGDLSSPTRIPLSATRGSN